MHLRSANATAQRPETIEPQRHQDTKEITGIRSAHAWCLCVLVVQEQPLVPETTRWCAKLPTREPRMALAGNEDIGHTNLCSSPGLGSELLGEVERALDQISSNPERCQRIGPRARRKSLWRFPYSLVYAIYPDRLRIVAFAHQKRRPFYWRKRLKDTAGRGRRPNQAMNADGCKAGPLPHFTTARLWLATLRCSR
jgi:hypothetical protein